MGRFARRCQWQMKAEKRYLVPCSAGTGMTSMSRAVREAGIPPAVRVRFLTVPPLTLSVLSGNKKAEVEDSTLVLLPLKGTVFYSSPDETNKGICGLVRREKIIDI